MRRSSHARMRACPTTSGRLRARGRPRAHVRDRRGRDRRLRRARCRPRRRPRPTSRPARPTRSGPRSGSSSTRSTSARAGSRRCASRPACRASARSRRGLRAHGPWRADELAAIEVAEVAAAFGQDPGHELMALFARALRELGAHVRAEHGGAFLALARARRRSAVALAERARRACRRGATSPPTTASPCRSSSARSSPPPTCTSRASRPRDDLAALTLFADNLVPHVLRHRRRAAVRPGARGPHRPRGAARARLARGGRDPGLRGARGRAAGRRARRDHDATRASTTCCGTVAAGRATRGGPATEPGRPRTDVDRTSLSGDQGRQGRARRWQPSHFLRTRISPRRLRSRSRSGRLDPAS